LLDACSLICVVGALLPNVLPLLCICGRVLHTAASLIFLPWQLFNYLFPRSAKATPLADRSALLLLLLTHNCRCVCCCCPLSRHPTTESSSLPAFYV
jgi:hypothetical protein